MKRIVLDQGLPATAVVILQQDGWDAVHVREIEMHKAADNEILDYAARESRVVITLDRDFPQILALTAASRPSVVLVARSGMRRQNERSKRKGSVVALEVAGPNLQFGQGSLTERSHYGTMSSALSARCQSQGNSDLLRGVSACSQRHGLLVSSRQTGDMV
jgi:predicted nuclease of predicted toxin-antitoxin system